MIYTAGVHLSRSGLNGVLYLYQIIIDSTDIIYIRITHINMYKIAS